jgi:hypothetical protein
MPTPPARAGSRAAALPSPVHHLRVADVYADITVEVVDKAILVVVQEDLGCVAVHLPG